ncbi:hypothetical protein MIND_00449100 [Mycena indigotica]|uniref:Uncharacterized protein n=1 Tax=Mycena indigotica TaxID=2126181 RepID=A0A8H6SWI5_9AGAR|nr:uncharacterized protein MIND_00449100 [Mycena indigotica]KAF7306578.1 hypothetical protein MIND_00449100 [Mycena indigotica]
MPNTLRSLPNPHREHLFFQNGFPWLAQMADTSKMLPADVFSTPRHAFNRSLNPTGPSWSPLASPYTESPSCRIWLSAVRVKVVANDPPLIHSIAPSYASDPKNPYAAQIAAEKGSAH